MLLFVFKIPSNCRRAPGGTGFIVGNPPPVAAMFLQVKRYVDLLFSVPVFDVCNLPEMASMIEAVNTSLLCASIFSGLLP